MDDTHGISTQQNQKWFRPSIYLGVTFLAVVIVIAVVYLSTLLALIKSENEEESENEEGYLLDPSLNVSFTTEMVNCSLYSCSCSHSPNCTQRKLKNYFTAEPPLIFTHCPKFNDKQEVLPNKTSYHNIWFGDRYILLEPSIHAGIYYPDSLEKHSWSTDQKGSISTKKVASISRSSLELMINLTDHLHLTEDKYGNKARIKMFVLSNEESLIRFSTIDKTYVFGVNFSLQSVHEIQVNRLVTVIRNRILVYSVQVNNSFELHLYTSDHRYFMRLHMQWVSDDCLNLCSHPSGRIAVLSKDYLRIFSKEGESVRQEPLYLHACEKIACFGTFILRMNKNTVHVHNWESRHLCHRGLSELDLEKVNLFNLAMVAKDKVAIMVGQGSHLSTFFVYEISPDERVCEGHPPTNMLQTPPMNGTLPVLKFKKAIQLKQNHTILWIGPNKLLLKSENIDLYRWVAEDDSVGMELIKSRTMEGKWHNASMLILPNGDIAVGKYEKTIVLSPYLHMKYTSTIENGKLLNTFGNDYLIYSVRSQSKTSKIKTYRACDHEYLMSSKSKSQIVHACGHCSKLIAIFYKNSYNSCKLETHKPGSNQKYEDVIRLKLIRVEGQFIIFCIDDHIYVTNSEYIKVFNWKGKEIGTLYHKYLNITKGETVYMMSKALDNNLVLATGVNNSITNINVYSMLYDIS